MRLAATLIGIFALVISSCSLQPHSAVENAAELEKLKGPEPGSIDKTLNTQAEQAVSLGDFKRAAQMYKQLSDKNPNNSEYSIALADSLRRSGDNEDGLKIINAVVKKDGKNATALEVKGLILMNIGEFSEASKTFDQVMSIDGKRWRTLNAIGIMFAVKKMDAQAISYYNEALKASPDNPSILNNLALALAMDKQYDASIECFTHARHFLPSTSPEIKRIDLNLALVYAIAGRLDDAEQTAAPHLSKAALYNNMGFYAYLSKNKELAKSYLNMALTQSPVYYERAWKNLNAVTEDNSSEANSGEHHDIAPANITGDKELFKENENTTSLPVPALPIEVTAPTPESKPVADAPAVKAPVQQESPPAPASTAPVVDLAKEKPQEIKSPDAATPQDATSDKYSYSPKDDKTDKPAVAEPAVQDTKPVTAPQDMQTDKPVLATPDADASKPALPPTVDSSPAAPNSNSNALFAPPANVRQ